MIVYKDYVVFTVLGVDIALISDETCHGRNTVAEINNQLYYLGDELPNIYSAVLTWQDLNKKDLSQEELYQVMIDNKLISEAI